MKRNFAVHGLEQISREFSLAVELKFPFFRFSILIKNNFIKRKERNEENEDKFNKVYFGNNSVENQ